MTAKIIIIDDEPGIRDALGALLEGEGYTTAQAGSGEEALELFAGDRFDLALLDLRLPSLDGESLLAELERRGVQTQVIIITGYASLDSAVGALRAGAADYLQKPLDPDDVLERVARALSQGELQSRKEMLLEQLTCSLEQLKDVEGLRGSELPARRVLKLGGGVMADLERRELWRGSDRVTLTPTESNLLSILLENRGRVLSHQELVFLVQGLEVEEDEAPEMLRPMISRLRKKLAAFPGAADWIGSVRGVGYLFDPE